MSSADQSYVLVPREPTMAMTLAFHEACPNRPSGWTAEQAWAAMLAAAPPAKGGGEPPQPETQAVERLEEALRVTRSIVSEGAMEGFNPLEGDWAERLFTNQGNISRALADPAPAPGASDGEA